MSMLIINTFLDKVVGAGLGPLQLNCPHGAVVSGLKELRMKSNN